MADRRVVISGRGVISPLGIGIESHQESLFSNRSFIRRSERLSLMDYPLYSAGEVSEEALQRALTIIPPKQRKLMNRAGILAAIASFQAAQEARLETDGVDPDRVGVFLATWLTCYDFPSFFKYLADTESKQNTGSMDSEKANIQWLEKMNPVDYSLKVLPNLTAGHVAILHQARGASRVIADPWCGGLLAVAQASQAIQDGELDVVLAGGAEAPLADGIFGDLCKLWVTAKSQNGAEGLCRPFDVGRLGTVIGEGAGVVVLEERDHALQRQATIYGEIQGWSSSGPRPEGQGEASLKSSMGKALLASGLSIHQVDLIHANGDSTPINDRTEWRAIEQLFGAQATVPPVTATKSLHGHLLSAAGAVELISALIMLERGRIPPIVYCDQPDPDCNLNLIRGATCERPEVKTVLLNAMGLFGEAASLIVGA